MSWKAFVVASLCWAVIAFRAEASDADRQVPEKDAEALGKIVNEAMEHYLEDKQAAYYRSIDKLQVEVTKLEEKLSFPALSDTGTWTGLLAESMVPKKLPKGVRATNKFQTKPTKLASVTHGEYMLSVPKSMKKVRPIPVILALHPPLEGRGKFSDKVKKWVIEKVGEDLMKTCIVIAPLNEAGDRWSGQDGRFLAFRSLSEGAIFTLPYDPARIFVFGDGPSAAEGLELASFFPSMFGGVIMAGAGPTEIALENLSNMYVLLVGDEAKELGAKSTK